MRNYKKEFAQLFDNQQLCYETYSAKTIFNGKELIVYGAGNGYIAFDNAVIKRCGLTPSLVLDQKFNKGSRFNGIPAEALANHVPSRDDRKNAVVVITVGHEEICRAIEHDLKCSGFENIIKSSDIFEFNVHHESEEVKRQGVDFYRENIKKIEKTIGLMDDDISKEVYFSVLGTYITRNPTKVPSRPCHEQYFPTDVQLHKGYSRFISCGAYDGDTVRGLFSKHGHVDAIACFEPDKKNFAKLSQYLKSNRAIATSIIAFPCGVFSGEMQLSFSDDKLLCSSIYDEASTVIQCVALDDVIPNFNPTFISMDVEGAELEALAGAVQIIRNNKPDLAISVYHFPNHIWEIPLYLNSLDLGYKFHLRNYTGFTYETVLYATAD